MESFPTSDKWHQWTIAEAGSVVGMTITANLFDAYLKCPTKCFLRALGETGTGNAYAAWTHAQNLSYQLEGVTRIKEGVANNECITGPLDRKELKFAKWRLAIDSKAYAQNLESTIHAVERVPCDTPGEPAQFIPIRFIFTNKLSRYDKLMLAFDALVLSETLGRQVHLGKILHGDDLITLRVKTAALDSEVRKITAKIAALLAGQAPPDLVLNRHCAECEFQKQCRQKAIEKDDLSLLAGITEDERNRHRSKGIFTVTQLSYTFRPRKAPKRAKNPARPRHPALQALAIRENTVYIHGSPKLPDAKAQAYLDIEGIPDSDSYYLIGVLIVSEGRETFHSFWADQTSQEPEIFARFAEVVCQLSDFRAFHFGDYESVALRRIKERLPEDVWPRIDAILERATNVLSVIHPHIYFPTYSNGLKDIGRFLGSERGEPDATGLQTIVWRNKWKETRSPDVKARLLQYNQDDCRTLKHVVEFIRELTPPEAAVTPQSRTPFRTIQTEDLNKERPRWELFRPREYASEDLQKVAKCAYFDYQREKVFVHTHPHFKIVNKKHRKFRRASSRANVVSSVELRRCPKCRSTAIERREQMSRDLIDLKFFRGGVKKWITRTVFWTYCCSKCMRLFSSHTRSPYRQKYGHQLMSWCVYSNVACGVNMLRVEKSLADLFDLAIPDCEAYRFKCYVSDLYKSLYAEILQNILASPVIYIDETTVRLRKQQGYVWVMASMDKVYYFYRPSREGSFLKDILGGFSGVLVSDFYTAYDSLECKQQKCLVHLVRDIDDDLLRHPLDTEFKSMVQEFGTLLRTIIETVDKRGLKTRYLRKHRRAVVRFLDSVASTSFSSPLAIKYKKRFEKSGKKMFTFLDHNGVAWNNNNAEHAIKRFAKYRRNTDGYFTERSLQEYLVLATVFETCEFNNLNVLKFLLSKETTLEGLLKMAGR
jgi:predicted RecB family nuclease